jgi:hypothetical protein
VSYVRRGGRRTNSARSCLRRPSAAERQWRERDRRTARCRHLASRASALSLLPPAAPNRADLPGPDSLPAAGSLTARVISGFSAPWLRGLGVVRGSCGHGVASVPCWRRLQRNGQGDVIARFTVCPHEVCAPRLGLLRGLSFSLLCIQNAHDCTIPSRELPSDVGIPKPTAS